MSFKNIALRQCHKKKSREKLAFMQLTSVNIQLAERASVIVTQNRLD